jgi:hypothetical protein
MSSKKLISAPVDAHRKLVTNEIPREPASVEIPN